MSEPYNTATLVPNPLDDADTKLYKLAAAAYSLAQSGGGGGGSGITDLTGDGTASGPGSAALTLATVNSNVGSFTNANVTVDAKGRVTAATNGTTGIGGNVSAAPAGSVLVSTGSGNNAQASSITLANSGSGLKMLGVYFDGDSFTTFIQRSGGNVQIVSPFLDVLCPISSKVSDTATNTVVTALTLTHATSATAAALLGVAEVFQLPSDAGALRSAGQVIAAWTSATDGAESSIVRIKGLDGGADSTFAEFSAAFTGLYGSEIRIPNISDDGNPHLVTGGFLATVDGVSRRILTGDP